MRRRQWRVETLEQGMTLKAFLSPRVEGSADIAETLVSRGAVYVRGRRCLDEQTVLEAGWNITAVLEEGGRSALTADAPPMPLEVLFEDAQLLAVNKPAGVYAQPTVGRVGESLLDLASAYLKKPAGLIHRLDKETSGVTLFGKTETATRFLTAQFREGRAEKTYLAVTGPGLPEKGIIDWPIAADPSRPGRQRAKQGAMGKAALTQYQRLALRADSSTVRLFPKTGRTHQLRAHLKALGFPIVGDALYEGSPGPRCLLHAETLTVRHPTSGEKLNLQARLPADMSPYFESE